MASFSLVHGSWHGGWCWDLVRVELEAHGHVVHAPDLPCEDVAAGVAEYAAAVPAADIVVGPTSSRPGSATASRATSSGARTTPIPPWPRPSSSTRPPTPGLASRLRREAPLAHESVAVDSAVYIVCARDAVIRPEWQRHLARDVLGVEPIELEAGHSPLLECPRELADVLDQAARRNFST